MSAESPVPAVPESPATGPSPVPDRQRIESIDVLRGVAVLGILALNIQAFAMPGVAYINPTAYGDFSGVNYGLWLLVHLLGDLKFWSIFSMLFGAGIVITTTRCEQTGRSAAGVHYRRMFWLLLFGLLHAHLIWFGDILYTYAMCGFVLYFFRKLSPRMLLVLGLIPLLIACCISTGFGWLLASETIPEMNQEMARSWSPDADMLQQELDAYRGSWLEQMPARVVSAIFSETFLFLTVFGWRSAGLILIGMGLYKLGVFSAERSRRFYGMLVAIALLGGLPLIGWGVYSHWQNDWSMEYSFYLGPLYNFWGSIPVALGWVGAVMLVCKSPRHQFLTRPFAATGRMALSCYLLQSIVCTWIYYGHGLGWFGYTERWQQYLLVVGVWAGLLVFAPVWLKYFRFGPFEWLWRTLTYMKIQPILAPRIDRPDSGA